MTFGRIYDMKEVHHFIEGQPVPAPWAPAHMPCAFGNATLKVASPCALGCDDSLGLVTAGPEELVPSLPVDPTQTEACETFGFQFIKS